MRYSELFQVPRKIIANPKARKELAVILFSLVVSVVLWFLIVLEKTYNSSLPFVISISDLPEGKVLKEALPKNNFLIINAKGWELLKLRRQKEPVRLDIDLSELSPGEKFVLTDQYKNDFPMLAASDVKVLKIIPDTLFLELDRLMSKTVKVCANLDIKCKRQYGLAGPVRIIPSEVIISGPQSYVRKIDSVYTTRYKADDIQSKLQLRLPLQPMPEKNITFRTADVMVKVPVDKLTEGKFNIIIKIFNVGNTRLTLIPDRIEVSFQAPLSLFNQVKPEDFIVYVDAGEQNTQGRNKLKVGLETSNPYLYFTSVYPDYVDFIINK